MKIMKFLDLIIKSYSMLRLKVSFVTVADNYIYSVQYVDLRYL